jgi:uracil-DNA glycosylase
MASALVGANAECAIDYIGRGSYAQKYYLNHRAERNLTATVSNFDAYLPDYFPLVHPSPLNIGWRKRNPWFEIDVVPVLQSIVRESLL